MENCRVNSSSVFVVFVKFWIRLFWSISIRLEREILPIFPVIFEVGSGVEVVLEWVRVWRREKKSGFRGSVGKNSWRMLK